MGEFDILAPFFRKAELRGESARVLGILCFLAGLLAAVLGRALSLPVPDRPAWIWPFALSIAAMITWQAVWLAFVRRSSRSGRGVSPGSWRAAAVVDCLLPTVAFAFQVEASADPERELISPVMLAWLVLLILSVLHLDAVLSLLCGLVSAAGYSLVAAYVLWRPETGAAAPAPVHLQTFACAAGLLAGGIAAASVAARLRRHVIAPGPRRGRIERPEPDPAVAWTIQQALLPKVAPRVDGFDIAGWNRPAAVTGGDYFDWQTLPDGQVAFTIADITGHGIGPVLAMASCRAYARAGMATEPDLGSLLGRLNQLLYDDLPPDGFVTMAVGLLDPMESTLEFISAGHCPLICYLSAEDRFRSYDAQGLPLGVMAEARYGRPQGLTLVPGDILVLTDGLAEWANSAGEAFGQKHLKEVIRASRNQPAASIIAELYRSVRDFAGSVPQPDDVTAVIVKRTPREK